MPTWQFYVTHAIQIIVPLLWFVCMWFWVIKPWRREGRMTSDGMMAIACWMIFVYDCIMNYTQLSLLYNSHMVNFGAWTYGIFPGWTQINGNLLPEPIFITIPGYMVLVYVQVVFICWLLAKAKMRWPNMGLGGTLAFIILGLTIVDSLIEILLIRTGILRLSRWDSRDYGFCR